MRVARSTVNTAGDTVRPDSVLEPSTPKTADQNPGGAAWARLTETMDRLGAEAAARGLTDAELDALVADDAEPFVVDTNV